MERVPKSVQNRHPRKEEAQDALRGKKSTQTTQPLQMEIQEPQIEP